MELISKKLSYALRSSSSRPCPILRSIEPGRWGRRVVAEAVARAEASASSMFLSEYRAAGEYRNEQQQQTMAQQRTLELTLISAKDLKTVNLLSKMEVYAVVSLYDDPGSRPRTRPITPVTATPPETPLPASPSRPPRRARSRQPRRRRG